MKYSNVKQTVAVALTSMSFCLAAASYCAPARADSPLAGTWTLVAADVQHPDGSRAHDYGADPKGLFMVDAKGNYSLQIFKTEREKFASEDKSRASAAEYKSAVMGSSTHFGTLSVDTDHKTLFFHIQHSSFPNWEGTEQKRSYTLKGNELSYFVSPRPNGDIPISVWKREN